ncbi:MAG: halocyanin domain-containing protein [Halobacteriaceae archaeon]
MSQASDTKTFGRRALLRTAVGTVAGVAAATGTASAQSEEFGGWLQDTTNYDGVVDKTGQDEVSVQVGVEQGPGPYGFGPPAIRVSPGTTVTWTWTGDGGAHNVHAMEGADFKSQTVSEAGHTFSHTFESEGTVKYQCDPHAPLGMKGVVDVAGGGGGDGGSGDGGGGPAISEVDLSGWLGDTKNFDEIQDETGQDEVSVQVGVEQGPGPYGFGPPAIRVSPGTTVTWTWTGDGGAHNVHAMEGADFKSQTVSEAGHTFSHTFESTGVVHYQCDPHAPLGMKGAVVVTGGGGGGGGQQQQGPAAANSANREISANPPGNRPGSPLLLLFGSGTLLVVLGVGASLLSRRRAYEYEPDRTEDGTLVAREAPEEGAANPIEHDEYDPMGTATLIAAYFLILVVMWVFTYFVEFLGRGPTVIG